jgi:LysR family transcriptional regulator, glycine cleavage system transcriptional activator
MFLNSATLASLRFFEAAARLLSFKRAALELHVTQGAVSQHIKRLEDVLGHKLFYRLPRGISLTDEGRRLAMAVETGFGHVDREARAIATTGSTVELRLRAGPSFALRWLVPRLGDFYGKVPSVRLFIVGAYGYFDLSHRDFDLAVERLPERLPALCSEFLMEEHLVPVCSPEYLSRLGPIEEPADFARCTLLHDAHAWNGASEDEEWRYWLREVGADRVDSTQGKFFSLANMALEAALVHQGVAMGRSTLILDLIQSGQLVTPLARPIKSPAKLYVVYPNEHADRQGLQPLVRWLHEQASASRVGAFQHGGGF